MRATCFFCDNIFLIAYNNKEWLLNKLTNKKLKRANSDKYGNETPLLLSSTAKTA